MTTHVMLDLEMASVHPNGAIVQLAAVSFTINPNKVCAPAGAFNAFVNNWETCGGHVDPETMAWWREQEAYPKVFGAAKHSPDTEVMVLDQFSEWLANAAKNGELALWGYPATSDLMWLECAYRRHGYRQLPWPYHAARDLHTLEKEVFSPEVPRETLEHDALADCLHQVRKVWAILGR